jgi:Acetyltransferase (GNAT) domain
MENVILTSVPDEPIAAAWNDCLDNAEFAGLYTAPEYFLIQYFANERPFAVLVVSSGVVHGVATGLLGDRDINCGHSGSPQICIRRGADAEKVGMALAAGIRSHSLKSTRFISAFTWDEVSGLQSAGFRAKRFETPLGTILLDLSRGADALFSDCTEARRRNIRRAIKAGVEVAEMDIGRDFDEYYALYEHWCAFKHQAARPYDVQRAVFASGANRLLLVARHGGRVVGVSTFRFRRPGIMEYTANVSRREESKLKQNDLLMWRAIEWSTQQKDIRYFSMAAAHTFLQRFGGERRPTYRYSLDRSPFRVHDLAEMGHAVAMQVYHALPPRAREGLKKLLRPDRDAES